MRSIRFQIIGAIVCCALLAACSQKTAPAGPKFKGRLLILSGDSATERSLIELTGGPNDSLNYNTVSSGIFEAAANPAQTLLVYATKDEVLLRDLHTGEVKSLVKGENFCLAWSLDGKRFSYKQRGNGSLKLYVSDVEGHETLVWNDVGAAPADTGCPQWVAPDKLIFVRFGPSQKRTSDVKPNTMTLATVGDSVTLVDTEKKWSVEGVCKTGAALLRSEEGQILIAKSLENLKTVNPTSGPCSICRFVGFAPQSCVPFFIEENSRDSSDLFYLNPANWQRQRSAHIGQTFSPAARMLINSSTRLMVVGDAPASLLLVDTESGDVTPLVSKSGPAFQLVSPVPVAWIEN